MPLKLRKNTMPTPQMRGRIPTISQKVIIGGEEGIRTPDTKTRILPFQGSPFDHSGTSPMVKLHIQSYFTASECIFKIRI